MNTSTEILRLMVAATLASIGMTTSAAPEIFAPGLVSTGTDDAHVAFAPDGQTMWFLRSTPDFMHWTVVESQRRGANWGTPRIAGFSGTWDDGDVFPTPDGRHIYFVSTRPVNGVPRQDTDIWVMDRGESGWSEPRHLDELSSPGFEWFPTLTADGTLYFGSEREGGLGASDIWRARWVGDRFSEPENLGATINSPDQEIEPLIAPDESWLIFAARGHKPGAGSYDLYVSYHCAGEWIAPKPLTGDVNSAGWDFGPRISPDGKSFYFTSNRALPRPTVRTIDALSTWIDAPGNGLRDVYRVPIAEIGLATPCAKEATP